MLAVARQRCAERGYRPCASASRRRPERSLRGGGVRSAALALRGDVLQRPGRRLHQPRARSGPAAGWRSSAGRRSTQPLVQAAARGRGAPAGPPEPQPPRAPGPLALARSATSRTSWPRPASPRSGSKRDDPADGRRDRGGGGRLCRAARPARRTDPGARPDAATRAAIVEEVAERFRPYQTAPASGSRRPCTSSPPAGADAAAAILAVRHRPRTAARRPALPNRSGPGNQPASASRRSASGCRLSVTTGSSRAPIRR